MTTIERDIDKYVSDVNSHLLCSSKKKKEIIEDIRGAVFDFAENSGVEDITEIHKHFGTPEELAKAHLIELDPKLLKKKVNIRKVLIVAVVAALAILVVALAIELVNAHRAGMGYFSEEVATEENVVAYINFDKNIGRYLR